MAEYWTLDRLTNEWMARGLSRRTLMQLVASGASATALMTLMGARPAGAQDTDDPRQVSMLWRQPVTLSPIFSTSGNEQHVERLMFGALAKMSAELEPVPDLSASIDVSDDARVYTFNLHQDITFTDGEQLTAEDVVFTFERAIDARTGSIWGGRLLGIEGAQAYRDGEADSISGIATPDDYTVELTMSEPDAAFLAILCNFSGLGILPAHVLGDVEPEQLEEHSFSMEPTVTAGAYKFVRFESDQYLELERHEDYFGDPPGVDRIFLRILTPEVGLAELERGELDLMAVPIAEVERMRNVENVNIVSVPSPSMDFIAINLNRPHLQDVDLRRAMMHAIDRQGIVNQVLQGEGTVVNSSIFGPEWMGTPEGLNEYEYDPDQARQILENSTWDMDDSIEIMHLPGNREKDAAIAIIQEQWREIGLRSEILQVDVAELNTRYIQENDFDVFYNAGGVFRADPSISGTYFLTRNFTPDGGNGSHYSNPQVDDLFAQGQATTDLEERAQVYTQIAQILNEELPWIFLWSPNSVFGVSQRLQGFEAPSYVDNTLWNAETWSVSDD